MATTIQPELIPATDRNWKKEDALAPVTPLSLMQIALERGQVEQLQILQDMHFKQMAQDAEIEFNEAMNACQSELGRISADMENSSTRSRYASYAQLDRAIRPIYTKHGLSLSFSEEDSPKPEHVRVICYVAKGMHTRIYRKDMPVVTTGPQGKAVMTLTHATASSGSYGKRHLVKDIFNLAIGEDDDDGNSGGAPVTDFKPQPAMDAEEFKERMEFFPKCSTLPELHDHWRASYGEAKKVGDRKAMDAFNAAKDERKKALLVVGK